MDFGWSDEQLSFRQETMEFAEGLSANVIAQDRASAFPHDDWRRCAEFGIQGFSVPSKYSGRKDIDFMSAMLAMEGFGEGCRDNGLAFALNAQIWTVQLPIFRFGSESQKARYLPAMTSGELIGAHALTEPESGSDAHSLQTTATPCDGGYLLNGTKRYISLGPVADVAIVFANVAPEKGRWGITAFLVDKGTAGFHAGSSTDKMGLRTTPMCDFHFNDCFVENANRLGDEGSGAGLSSSSLEYERCCILASQLGAMERQLRDAFRYAKKRKQFGQPIEKFQSVSNRLANMKLRLETCRLLLYKAAWLKQAGKPAGMEVALLKLHLSESFLESSLDSVRIHGGAGYMSAGGVERDVRDAVGGTIYAGTSDIQRNIIAALLGL